MMYDNIFLLKLHKTMCTISSGQTRDLDKDLEGSYTAGNQVTLGRGLGPDIVRGDFSLSVFILCKRTLL